MKAYEWFWENPIRNIWAHIEFSAFWLRIWDWFEISSETLEERHTWGYCFSGEAGVNPVSVSEHHLRCSGDLVTGFSFLWVFGLCLLISVILRWSSGSQTLCWQLKGDTYTIHGLRDYDDTSIIKLAALALWGFSAAVDRWNTLPLLTLWLHSAAWTFETRQETRVQQLVCVSFPAGPQRVARVTLSLYREQGTLSEHYGKAMNTHSSSNINRTFSENVSKLLACF